jgi:hypothetical protein
VCWEREDRSALESRERAGSDFYSVPCGEQRAVRRAWRPDASHALDVRFPIIERVKPRGVLGFEFVWTLGLSDFASLVGPRAWKEEWPNMELETVQTISVRQKSLKKNRKKLV